MNAHSPIIGSPLHVACSEYIENRSVLLELLLAAGADPNVVVKSEDGYFLRPVLGEYLQSNQQQLSMEVIQLLLQHGTRVSARRSGRWWVWRTGSRRGSERHGDTLTAAAV